MVVAYVTNQMYEPAEDNRGLEIVMSASASTEATASIFRSPRLRAEDDAVPLRRR